MFRNGRPRNRRYDESMIVEIDGEQYDTNFCMFDGNTFQVWENKEHGGMVVDIHDNNIAKIIVIRKK